jgi:hypothetical protein
MTNNTQPGGTVVPIRQSRPSAATRPGNSPEAEIRRNTLRRFLREHQITVAELARRAGLRNANMVHNHLNGGSASLSLATIEKILRAFPGASLADLTGIKVAGADRPSTAPTPFVVSLIAETGIVPNGRAAAMEPALQLPIPPGTVPPGPGLFAIKVASPGAEHLFALGSLLICQRLIDSVEDLPDGTLVVLRAHGRTHTRVDVREAEHFDHRLWLWTRSTHPDWQQPLPMPPPLIAPARMAGGETVAILGIVVASWQPQAPMVPI